MSKAEAQSEQSKTKTPWYTGLFKWLFFISAFVLIMITVLANIGGDSDFYRDSIEQYAQEATAYNARLTKLNKVSFFPSIEFDFEGLNLFHAPEDEVPVATLGSAHFKAGFWDVAFRSGKIKALELRDFSALPGAFTGKALQVKSITIAEDYLDEEGKAALVAEGKIGADPLKAVINLDVFGRGQGRKYRLSTAQGFGFTTGNLSLSGAVDDGVFKELKLKLAGEDVLSGKLALKRKTKHELVAQGEWLLAGHATQLEHNLVFSDKNGAKVLEGKISSTAFHPEDFTDGSGLRRFIDTFDEMFFGKGTGGFTLPLQSMDVDIAIDKFMLGTADLGSLKAKAEIAEQVLNIHADKDFAFSDFKGDVTLAALENGPKLNIDMSFKGFDYGALQKQFNEEAELSGNADIVLKLEGQSADLSSLVRSLDGNFTFIGGEGRLRTELINLWGGGLVNALLPDADPQERTQVNCAIMDFTVEEGLAKSNALFMDLSRMTVAGEGTYDLDKDKLDIVLTPKPKSIALGDVSSSVRVSGPLGKPSAAPDLRGIGRKIGGLLLGAVNPVFLAYSLTDLGLNEDHPCAAYMKAEEDVREVPAVARDGQNE